MSKLLAITVSRFKHPNCSLHITSEGPLGLCVQHPSNHLDLQSAIFCGTFTNYVSPVTKLVAIKCFKHQLEIGIIDVSLVKIWGSEKPSLTWS